MPAVVHVAPAGGSGRSVCQCSLNLEARTHGVVGWRKVLE
jgi:hypothetical protein